MLFSSIALILQWLANVVVGVDSPMTYWEAFSTYGVSFLLADYAFRLSERIR